MGIFIFPPLDCGIVDKPVKAMRQDLVGYSMLLALVALIAIGLVSGAQAERHGTSSITSGALTGATGNRR